ncbi:MAG: hypothetical protein ACOC1F_07035, partial [Myxococcota bacterium]
NLGRWGSVRSEFAKRCPCLCARSEAGSTKRGSDLLQHHRRPSPSRFGFDVVLPHTVKSADTTSITVLGIERELIAVQDVGGRDTNLLDGVLVAPTETSEMVTELMRKCLAGQAGAQMLTDQGTP